jgi:hypothetical protein
MTTPTRKEYTVLVAQRYLKAKRRHEKGKILDEFCATVGYSRKHAIALLRAILFNSTKKHKRTREKQYSSATDAALIVVWREYGYLCAERLHPFMSEAVNKLEQFGYLKIPSTVKEELLRMSRSSIARRIHGHQERMHGTRFSTTKPGSLLKKNIPLQTTAWDEQRPGFCEIDLVAHCGGSLAGDFIYTLQSVDIATTWTERIAVMGKSQKRVFAGIEKIRGLLPFPLLGIDSDNGSEFINAHLVQWCRQQGIAFTRSRPYMSKDNAHIEQKNWPLVRKLLGYQRYDTDRQLTLINDLYDNELRLFLNFFQPSLKLKEKTRIGAKIKRKHDKAKTPYQRIMESPTIDEERKRRLKAIYDHLDPVLLKRKVDEKIRKLFSSFGTNLR